MNSKQDTLRRSCNEEPSTDIDNDGETSSKSSDLKRHKERRNSLGANGYHEHEVLGPGLETQESARAARVCKKNPGHTNFLLAKDLTKEHLPKPYQADVEIFEFMKVVIDLTVRLRVWGTSPERPAGGYYGAKDGGIRVGTGFISSVLTSEAPCQSLTCEDGSECSHLSWKFLVRTAKHVVYDDFEARLTVPDLFYDSEESRIDGKMKTVKGGGRALATVDKIDWCRLEFTSCDAALVTRLKKLEKRRKTLGQILVERYGSNTSSNLVWIVSHPHGIAKRVTFGEFQEERELGNDDYQYSYCADTCPGSSGAPVWQVKHRVEMSFMLLLLTTHQGLDDYQLLGSGPEDQETANAMENCEKNPGHETFIPVDKLTKGHLPKRYYKDEELFDFIKVAAALTVRVRVRGTSSDRPDGGFYGAKAGHTRAGTGYIWDAWTGDEPCQCTSCGAKPQESRKCWRFGAVTARQLVFDDSEAKMTCVDLFYDNEASRKDGSMKTVEGGEMWYTDVENGQSWLMFKTCDAELIAKFEELVKQRVRLGSSLVKHYRSEGSHNVVCVVSHPHGNFKHVTFGEFTGGEGLEEGCYQSMYSVDSCPGSGGAIVWKTSTRGASVCKVLLSQGHHCKGGGENGWNVGFH